MVRFLHLELLRETLLRLETDDSIMFSVLRRRDQHAPHLQFGSK